MRGGKGNFISDVGKGGKNKLEKSEKAKEEASLSITSEGLVASCTYIREREMERKRVNVHF